MIGKTPSGNPYKVIIGDTGFQGKQLQQILESEGFKVVCVVTDGKDLVKKVLENKTIDLIFIELNLPIVDGFAAFYELKEKTILPRIMIISEENTPAVMKNLLDNGAMDYSVKPIKREKILPKIQEVLKKIPSMSAR